MYQYCNGDWSGIRTHAPEEKRAQSGLPKIFLSEDRLARFDPQDWTKEICSQTEIIVEDGPTEDPGKNSLQIFNLARNPDPENLLRFLAEIPPRHPECLIFVFSNYLERDVRRTIIRLISNQEINLILGYFQDGPLLNDIQRVKQAQLARYILRFQLGHHPQFQGPQGEIIEIEDEKDAGQA